VRAEDIIGLSFFLVLFAGIGLMLYGTTRPVGSRQRSLGQATGLGIQGFAFLAFGLATSYCIRTSAGVVVEGNIWAVGQPMRGASHFKVTDDSGQVTSIRCKYRGPGLREGDRARIQYIAYNGTLVELTMLTGSYAGWELEESTGEVGPLLFAGVGLVCGLVGWRVWRKGEAGLRSTRD
jgi:hypothetical protein